MITELLRAFLDYMERNPENHNDSALAFHFVDLDEQGTFSWERGPMNNREIVKSWVSVYEAINWFENN